MKNTLNCFVLDNDQYILCYITIIKKNMLLVSLGFASGTNNILLSLSIRDNIFGMLVSVGFTSGTRQCLGYYLLISNNVNNNNTQCILVESHSLIDVLGSIYILHNVIF